MATNYINRTPIINQTPTMQGVNYAIFSCDISKLSASFTGFVINDTVALVDMPNFCTLVDWYLDIPALDSSTGIVESVGDTGADATHGMVSAGGFATGLTLGRSSGGGTMRAGGTGYVAGSIPFLYSVPWANIPTTPVLGLAPSFSFMLKITTAPTGTPAATGLIKGWVCYQMLSPSEMATQTGAVKPL